MILLVCLPFYHWLPNVKKVRGTIPRHHTQTGPTALSKLLRCLQGLSQCLFLKSNNRTGTVTHLHTCRNISSVCNHIILYRLLAIIWEPTILHCDFSQELKTLNCPCVWMLSMNVVCLSVFLRWLTSNQSRVYPLSRPRYAGKWPRPLLTLYDSKRDRKWHTGWSK